MALGISTTEMLRLLATALFVAYFAPRFRLWGVRFLIRQRLKRGGYPFRTKREAREWAWERAWLIRKDTDEEMVLTKRTRFLGSTVQIILKQRYDAKWH